MTRHFARQAIVDYLNIMQAITNFFKQNEKLIFAATTSCLAAYLLVRAGIWKGPSTDKATNLLDVSLATLIANKSHARIKKIVITASSSSKGEFRKNLINFLKEGLTEQRIKVLINCSPQKLLRAGCECFLESMEAGDSEYLHYYYNAVKAQLLIEDTIASIELISGSEGQIVMICDNNPFDIKLLNPTDELWHQFLARNQLDQQALLDSYDLVLHIIEKDSNAEEDERIREAWSSKKEYHQVRVFERDVRENFKLALGKILAFLAAGDRPLG